MGHLLGYARVSTTDQQPQLQVDALTAAGCYRVFTETASGARADRPILAQALDQLRPGDTLVVWKLDRLGRSLAIWSTSSPAWLSAASGSGRSRSRSTPPPPAASFRDRAYVIWCEFLNADDETAVLPAHIDGLREVQEAFSPRTASDRVVVRAWDRAAGCFIRKIRGSQASPVPLTTKDRLMVRVKLYDLGSRAGCSMQCGEPSRRLLDIMDSRPFHL
jgi:hypothetical protein